MSLYALLWHEKENVARGEGKSLEAKFSIKRKSYLVALCIQHKHTVRKSCNTLTYILPVCIDTKKSWRTRKKEWGEVGWKDLVSSE